MRKIFHIFFALASLSLFSCSTDDETARKPVTPTSDESDMPWNRPTGPEGGGALSILDQR